MWRIDRERRNSRPFRTLLTLFVCLALTLAFSIIRSTAERPTSGQFPPATGPLPQTTPLEWPEEDLSGPDDGRRPPFRRSGDQRTRRRRPPDSGTTTARRRPPGRSGSTRTALVSAGSSASSIPAWLQAWNATVMTRTLPWLRRRAGTGCIRSAGRCSTGFRQEGLLVEPAARAPSAHLVVVPDAGQIPEVILGLAPGLPPRAAVCAAARGERMRASHPLP